MNSRRHCLDTSAWLRSESLSPDLICRDVLAEPSIGTGSRACAIWRGPSFVRQVLLAALSGYTLWLATTLGFPSRAS